MQSISTDFLIRLKNGSLAGRKTITAPCSKYNLSLAGLIKKHGFIKDFSAEGDVIKTITVTLAYLETKPVITDIKIFSKPGRRLYEKSFSLPWGKTKKSLIIISTSKGVMSQRQAKALGIGGEIVAEIY